MHEPVYLGRVYISADDARALDVKHGINRAVAAVVICHLVCKLPAFKPRLKRKVRALIRLHVGIVPDRALEFLWKQNSALGLAGRIDHPAI